ncbi:unnamed protein product [Linum tenue]|uniref:LIM zinc-binding domain-containing protein n=1 Tax=Linum tenue TaxID=586396 RepID=A0AAV0IPZ0_9ROSI|nr:unnamed protein product [Linum tenue]
MATFAGTTEKCKACEKTVYLVDQLAADNKVYHKACFRCHHCKGTLKLSNYSSFEGVLYCKPHFDQLFKMTGSLDKSFEGSINCSDHYCFSGTQSSSKISSMFAGTQDKCVACKKTVYPLEKVINHSQTSTSVEIMKESSLRLHTRPFHDMFFFSGGSRWHIISQGVLQVHPWRLCNQSFKLCGPRSAPLLQTPPHPALQGEGQLQPT